jgi:membrane protease YdiL (CAAX protease family)
MARARKARKTMTLFDEGPTPPEHPPTEPEKASKPGEPDLRPEQPPQLMREDVLAAEQIPPTPPARRFYPQDLNISWSWAHLIVFVIFGALTLVTIQVIMALYLVGGKRLNPKQLEQYLLSKPAFAIGSMLIWYAALFLFLYVTLALLRGHPFWESLGWRKLKPRLSGLPRNPLVFFASGCGLSLFVALSTYRMKTPENIPMEELFKYRNTALLFMAMAVLVAPLVEETLFRGYLYPLFARSFGIVPGIVVTGVLFGLMHGAQLGWTWGLVTVLIIVGIVLTIVRARTGTVFASYLMHLGYNSLISFFAIWGTHGFTKLPPH